MTAAPEATIRTALAGGRHVRTFDHEHPASHAPTAPPDRARDDASWVFVMLSLDVADEIRDTASFELEIALD